MVLLCRTMPHRSSLIGSLLVCLCVIAATGWNPKGVAVASLLAAPDRTDLRIDGEPGKLVTVAELTTAEIMNPAVANRDPSFVSPRSQFRARPASSATKAARSIASQANSARDQELVPSLAQTISTPNVDVVTLADTGLVPPDTMGDVGLTQYLVAVNGLVRTFTKATGAPDGRLNTTLDTFFLTVSNGEQTTNPRVRYDRRSGRWYVLAITLALPNRILLAVSSSDEITNSTSWQFFASVNTRTSVFVSPQGLPCLADFPTLGVDEDALYVGVNQFCAPAGTAFPLGEGARDSASGYVISKASLFDANPDVAITAFHELSTGTAGPGPYTPQGVDNFDSNTNVGYFIGVDNAALDQLQLVRIFDPAGSPPLARAVSRSRSNRPSSRWTCRTPVGSSCSGPRTIGSTRRSSGRVISGPITRSRWTPPEKRSWVADARRSVGTSSRAWILHRASGRSAPSSIPRPRLPPRTSWGRSR